VSLIETHRLWFKSIVGLDAKELCRNTAFCSFTVAQDKPLIVLDALEDDRFKTQPLVCNPPHIRFYAGAQLRTKEGLNLGTLCVSDFRPRTKEEFGYVTIIYSNL
jgi:GAF domain-containing protein